MVTSCTLNFSFFHEISKKQEEDAKNDGAVYENSSA